MNNTLRVCVLVTGFGLFFSVAGLIFLALSSRPRLLPDLFGRFTHRDSNEFLADKPEHIGEHKGMRLRLVRRIKGERGTDRDVVLKFDEECHLAPVVEYGGQVYSPFRGLRLAGKAVPATAVRPLEELPGLRRVVWIKVEPEKRSYSNGNDKRGWWDAITYRETHWKGQANATAPADVSPLWLGGVEWEGTPVGSMRYKVALEFDGFYLSSPGRENIGRGGQLPGVLRVSRLGGAKNPSVDQALALSNLPYIWGSAEFRGSAAPSSHQAEQYIGADCADMVVAAWRKSGITNMRYSGAVPLVHALGGNKSAATIGSMEEGVYLDTRGREIVIGPEGIQPGAGVFWVYRNGTRGHAGMLAQDSGPDGVANGILDRHDLVLHTSWAPPILQELGDIMLGMLPTLVVNAADAG